MRHRHSFNRVLISLMLSALVLTSSVVAGNMPLPTPEATSSITARDLRRHLSFLASNELGGRYTLSPSNLIAARYLASQLESYGYRGAARDGSFFQRVPLSYRSVDLASSRATLHAGNVTKEFTYADEFSADVPTNININGTLVFAGYGFSSPKNNYDDYAGLNAKGKIVVAITGVPEPLSGLRLSNEEQAESAALAHGAIGMIRIPDAQTLLAWGQLKALLGSRQLGLPPKTTTSGKVLPEINAGPDLIKAIAKAMGRESSELVAADSKLRP